jgi:hypothetical protein
MSEGNQEQAKTGSCACAGVGPALSDLLKRLGPPEEVQSHFRAARVELLKGLRALIDQRIQDLSAQPAKGTKLTVD